MVPEGSADDVGDLPDSHRHGNFVEWLDPAAPREPVQIASSRGRAAIFRVPARQSREILTRPQAVLNGSNARVSRSCILRCGRGAGKSDHNVAAPDFAGGGLAVRELDDVQSVSCSHGIGRDLTDLKGVSSVLKLRHHLAGRKIVQVPVVPLCRRVFGERLDQGREVSPGLSLANDVVGLTVSLGRILR